MINKKYLIPYDVLVDENGPRSGAVTFISRLKELGIPYVIITEHSAKRRERMAELMGQIGFDTIDPRRIYTSVMAAVDYAAMRMPDKTRIMCMGGSGLRNTLQEVHFEVSRTAPDILFVGMNTNLTYQDYCDALNALHKGALLFSTDDRRIQYHHGDLDIGNGAVIKMLEYASGVKAIHFGMGSEELLRMAIRYMSFAPEDAVVVGMDIERDILPAKNVGIETIYVSLGRDLEESGITQINYPTYFVEDLYGLSK
ncbi:MAG: HAD hydrolase-like protein [Solobacterium sp.]|nr:HAD hydrolase-like protein [Solobacterium sp.]